MRLCTKKVARYNFILALALLPYLLLSAPTPAHGSQTANNSAIETIVIDPGHGGENHGAKGRDGTLEKTVALKLSQLIAKRLQHRFRVLLTRNDDQDVPLSDRTALANHHRADLFVSIHMGAAFRKDVTGSFILYYSPPQKKIFEPETKLTQLPNNQAPQALKWINVQENHISTSRRLAEKLRSELNKQTGIIPPSVGSAPLFVLAGADLPALYIEPFYLTHPDSEGTYQDDENMERLSNALAAAIAAIMQKE